MTARKSVKCMPGAHGNSRIISHICDLQHKTSAGRDGDGFAGAGVVSVVAPYELDGIPKSVGGGREEPRTRENVYW